MRARKFFRSGNDEYGRSSGVGPLSGRRLILSGLLMSLGTGLGILLPGCSAMAPIEETSKVIPRENAPVIRYAGSSTVANFIREAEPVYRWARFVIDAPPQSRGGESALLEGEADLAGIACDPIPEIRELGIQATVIGTDTIVVMVNPGNPVPQVTLAQLRDIFTGRLRNWRDLGGMDLEIVPMMVGPQSGTAEVFRALVLGTEDYTAGRVVPDDAFLTVEIEQEPGAIGVLSSSFICSGGSVRVLKVDGEVPLPSNLRYPLVRPIYLLWQQSNSVVADFIAWTSTEEAEEVITRCFGRRRNPTQHPLLNPD